MTYVAYYERFLFNQHANKKKGKVYSNQRQRGWNLFMRADGVLESAYRPYVCLCSLGCFGQVFEVFGLQVNLGYEY